jgi:putative oxidoreductase
MKREIIIEIIAAILIGLFLYASLSKYLDFEAFNRAMHNQPFRPWFATFLTWTVPPAEILIILLLCRERTQQQGLYASFGILTLFTAYIAVILLHFFPRIPCSCGGVISKLTWTQHLLFNLFFITVSLTGIILKSTLLRKKKRKHSQ